MSELIDRLQQSLSARNPIIFLHTAEESRIMDALGAIATRHDSKSIVSWSCTDGLKHEPQDAEYDAAPDPAALNEQDSLDPVVAIKSVVDAAAPGFYVFKDLTDFMDDPAVVRALRDAYFRLKTVRGAFLFIVSPNLEIPPLLEKNVSVVDIPLPDTQELIAMVQSVIAEHSRHKMSDTLLRDVALSLRGITLDQATHIMYRVLHGDKLSRGRLLDEIRFTKKAIAANASFLQYVPVQRDLTHVGGLSNFKSWIEDRSTVFSQKSVDAGLPIPKGVLIMGVSGCGKSLCSKVVAKIWNVPLFRLDMNLIFSDMYGNPEAAFHNALKTIESLAPAVLWIDEIENGLGFTEQFNPVHQHIFSAFLTWMQEKPPLIFVAATANRIESLPAELIRKGRFDQVFFVDLPDEKERAELFDIHLRLNAADPGTFTMRSLVLETQGWNGAEIEQVVNAARIHGHHRKRAFTTQDIVAHARNIVPLSRTMEEQIKMLRDWAWDRATPASKGKGTDFSILEEAKK